jgi:hypothetical protein
MRFRTKIFTPLLMVAVFTAALIAVFVGGPMMDLRRTKVLAISATAATKLDRDVHQNIRLRSDQDSPDYKRLEGQLRRAARADRLVTVA